MLATLPLMIKRPSFQFAMASALGALGALALYPVAANAKTDPLIEGARQCTQYFPVEEKKNSIPTHLLAAIATTESGRYSKSLGMSVPWPWTINVEGKGYHFDSKAEAIAITQSFLAQGYRSIDVGCMQVNLKHHPKAFANLNQAFDPATNVAYSAKFLSTNYRTLGDWIKATAAYHSRTPAHGQRYLGNIERNWNKIVGKVAAARTSKADEGTTNVAVTTAPTQNRSAAEAKPRVIASNTRVAMQQPRRVRVIQVSDTTRRENDVLVVRASSAPVEPITVADVPAQFSPTQGNSIRQVSLDNQATSRLPVARPNGPQFVFAN